MSTASDLLALGHCPYCDAERGRPDGWGGSPEMFAEFKRAHDAGHPDTNYGACYDCGRRYGDEYGFPDLVVPHDVWAKISPRGDEGGLLCPSCMCRRAHALSLSNIVARFRSGPFREREDKANG